MFIIGKEYQRRKLHELYGGQRYGGISTPKNYPFIMLFTGESGQNYGYKDYWEDGVFYYTGEGQKGPMQFTKGNKAIREHNENGKDLYLFQYVRKGVVAFVNQLTYIGHHFENDGQREIIVFHLAISDLVNQWDETPIESEDFKTNDLHTLKKIALDQQIKTQSSTITEGKVIYRKRTLAVKKYALARSKGKCEACGQPAPFINKKNEPFLEVHHLRRLSDGGYDHPEHVAAICPNCHRRVHNGIDGKDYNEKLIQKIHQKEKRLNINC